MEISFDNDKKSGTMMYIPQTESRMTVKPVKKPTACYCLKTRRATASVTKHYDQALAPCGITINQFSVLMNIARTEKCSVRELADMAELDKSTLARNLKPLYRMGLVVDTKEPGMRNSQLALTKAGKKTIECATPLWAEAQQALTDKLGKDGVRALELVTGVLDGW